MHILRKEAKHSNLPDDFIIIDADEQQDMVFSFLNEEVSRHSERKKRKKPLRAEFYQHLSIETRSEIRNKVTLSTIHGAKGLEFKHVFLIRLNDRVLPDRRAIEAEAVAITRAMDHRKFHFQRAANVEVEKKISKLAVFLRTFHPNFMKGEAENRKTSLCSISRRR